MRYDHNLTVSEAISQFYEDNGFSKEDTKRNFYRLQLGPFITYIHNPEARKQVLHLHDLEHILYEVDTTIAGEAEISAISLAARGHKPLAAIAYGVLGVATGLIVDRKRTVKGIIKGLKRRSIFDLGFGEKIWEMTLGELRQELGIFVV